MINLNELLRFDKIIIQCHDNPDPDAIGCAFAVSEYLKCFAKETEIIYSGFAPISKSNLKLMLDKLKIEMRFVPKTEEFLDAIEPNTLLLVVDGQYGAGNVKRFAAATVGVIDHHVTETPLVSYSDIRPYLGSCSTLVWILLKAAGFDFTKNERVSTALYYGLFTDTGSLAEITHPLDKDARDNLNYDKGLIKKLKNCNLTSADLVLAGRGLASCHANPDAKSALFSCEPCDPNILGFVSDLALQVDNFDTCAVFCEVSGGIKLSVRSCTKEVMANELAAKLCEGGGSGGGHTDKAGGFISGGYIEKSGLTPLEHLAKCYSDYFGQCDLVYSGEYKPDLAEFERYAKVKVPIGFVKTTDVFPDGTEMQIRTLEGDSYVTAGRDIYIMVGIRQEIYPIKREKFENSYRVLKGKYKPHPELFGENHYKPMVKERREGASKSVEEFIRACVSLGETIIYAKQLRKNTKVFTRWNNEGYMYGCAGDWLAVREDDLNDVYIIEDSIFNLTYRKV